MGNIVNIAVNFEDVPAMLGLAYPGVSAERALVNEIVRLRTEVAALKASGVRLVVDNGAGLVDSPRRCGIDPDAEALAIASVVAGPGNSARDADPCGRWRSVIAKHLREMLKPRPGEKMLLSMTTPETGPRYVTLDDGTRWYESHDTRVLEAFMQLHVAVRVILNQGRIEGPPEATRQFKEAVQAADKVLL